MTAWPPLLYPPLLNMRRVLATLDQASFNRMVRVVLGLRTPAQQQEPVTLALQLKMLLWEWLCHLGYLSDSQCRLLLAQTSTTLEHLAERYATSTERPGCLISIVDMRYAVWPEREVWLDVEEEIELAELPAPPCHFHGCDLAGLLFRAQGWLHKLQGGGDGEVPSVPGGGKRDPAPEAQDATGE